MDKKETVRDIWRSAFDDSDAYVEWYFGNVYHDEDAMLHHAGQKPVSSMLLQRYMMTFHGTTVPIGYICGAATLKEARCHGHMGQLIEEGLRESFSRGDLFCTLIPANDHLYRYYGRYGFSPAFYIGVERYTALHRFGDTQPGYAEAKDCSREDLFDFFDRMMRRRPCCVQHSAEDFANILEDNRLDGGTVVATSLNGELKGIAFSTIRDGECVVTDILAEDSESRQATLRLLRKYYEEIPITVLAYPDKEDVLAPRGMIRIVNARRTLGIIAESNRGLRCNIRLCDPVISENNATFVITDGHCATADRSDIHLDYDIDVEVLTSIVFGNDTTHRILDFPTERPFISLMLD